MEVYFICNNSLENNLSYSDRNNLEIKKMTRPLSSDGERIAKNIATSDEFLGADMIYSSIYSASLDSAKYLAERLDIKIFVDELLNDSKIGVLGRRTLKEFKQMQNRDFDIKLSEGESLNDVSNRITSFMKKVENIGTFDKVLLFTHRRVLLGYLLNVAEVGYNLNDDLVVSWNEGVVYDETDKDIDIIKVIIENKEIANIEVIDL